MALVTPDDRVLIDWADDGLYGHPLSDVTADVDEYVIDMGMDVGVDADAMLDLPATGRLRLFSPRGRYDPGVSQGLTAAQLGTPHLIKVEAHWPLATPGGLRDYACPLGGAV